MTMRDASSSYLYYSIKRDCLIYKGRLSNKFKDHKETGKSGNWTADEASASPTWHDDASRVVPQKNKRLPTLVRQSLVLCNK